MESESTTSINQAEQPAANGPDTNGRAGVSSGDPCLEDLDETTLKGLRILARILVRAYLRKVGAWSSPECESVPLEANHAADAEPDAPPLEITGD